MSSSALHPKSAHTRSRASASTLALVAGGLLLLIGALSLIPGITTDYGTLAFAANSSALFLGIFQTSVLLSVIYALVGATGLLLSRLPIEARAYLVGAGAFFLVLWIYGLFANAEMVANIFSTNAATSWAHLVLGVALAAAGAVATEDAEEVRNT
ncbi:DUF4383 domain-containing protein [Arthrobacter sp. NPDC092385]|uniref:DUF4383 domain-containing protein n=1 Tax=Arthrobacter sp. NPDC092385 TaxID=3363943 RepID=UPI0038093521